MNDKVKITESTKEKLESTGVDLKNQNDIDLIQKVNESNVAVARMEEDKIVIKECLNG